jgi:hypothetical protein
MGGTITKMTDSLTNIRTLGEMAFIAKCHLRQSRKASQKEEAKEPKSQAVKYLCGR